MKTRTGFVSNSSSSSFVVVGVCIDKETFELLGGYEALEKQFNYVDQPDGYNGRAIVGERLARWSDGEGTIITKSLSDVSKLAFEIDREINKLCPENTPTVELIFGETY